VDVIFFSFYLDFNIVRTMQKNQNQNKIFKIKTKKSKSEHFYFSIRNKTKQKQNKKLKTKTQKQKQPPDGITVPRPRAVVPQQTHRLKKQQKLNTKKT